MRMLRKNQWENLWKNVRKNLWKKFAAVLAMVLFLSFPVAAENDGRTCYVNDEENHVYASGADSSKQIALTFDDGPHPVYTDRILDVLGKYGVRATFFAIGQNVEYYPEPFARLVAEGHSVGGHTYSHGHIKGMTQQRLQEEFMKSRKVFEKFGVTPRLFRPPEGVCDEKVIEISAKESCEIILWRVDTGDWRSPSKEHIVETVLNHVKGGEIILMHDYVAGKSNTPDALEVLLPELLSRGYEFVTVEELIGCVE